MAELNETHDPNRRSWIESANRPDTDFPIQNLPFGVFRPPGGEPRGGVAIGAQIVDLAGAVQAGVLTGEAKGAAEAAAGPQLNALMALEPATISALRSQLSDLLREGGSEGLRSRADRLLAPMRIMWCVEQEKSV